MLLKTLLLPLCLIPYLMLAQSPYKIDWKKEPAYFSTGIVMLSGGLYLHYNTDALSGEEILALDRANVNSFDRKATFNLSSTASDLSDVFLIGSHALPLLFLSNKKSRNDFGTIMLLFGETLLLTEGVTNLTKRIAKRPRPYVYNELADLSKKQRPQARYSFFSGHTSVTSSNCFFMAKVFSDYFPESNLKPYVWTVAAMLPAVTGYLRVKAGKHYYSDVMTGYAIGGIIGFMVPHLHKIQKDKTISVLPAPNGLSLTWKLTQ